MSGLLGIWNYDGLAVDAAKFQEALSRLDHRALDGANGWMEQGVSLARAFTQVTPEDRSESACFVTETGVILWDGRLDDVSDLQRRLDGVHAADAPSGGDSALVAAAYGRWGDDVARHLLGDFAFAIFDRSRRALLLGRDPLGTRPLYYARAGSTVVFASEIKSILASGAVRSQPNDDLLARYLLRFWPSRDDGSTFFEDVYSIPAGHCVRFDQDGGARISRYWDFDTTRRDRYRDGVEYVEGFVHHFDASLRRRLRAIDPPVVSLSGGLDSSSIYCEALWLSRETGREAPLRAVSVISDREELDERRYISDIEQKHHVRVERVDRQPSSLLGREVGFAWTTEWPASDWSSSTTSAFLNAVRGTGARVFMSGLWGDHMTRDTSYMIDLFRGFHWVSLLKHAGEYPRWLRDSDAMQLQRMFGWEILRSLVPEVTRPALRAVRLRVAEDDQQMSWYGDRLRTRLHRSSSGVPRGSAHARSLYLSVRSKHQAWSMESNNKLYAANGLGVVYPFVDRELVSYLMSIPGDEISRGGVPRSIVRRGLDGVLPDSIRDRRWKADATSSVHEAYLAESDALAEGFRRGSLAASMGYIRQDVLDDELSRGRRMGYEVERRMSELLGLEAWLKAFFGGGDGG